MEKIFQKIPILRIALAYAVGIVAANYIPLNLNFTLGTTIALFCAVVFLHLKYSFTFEAFWGILVAALFFLLGYTFFHQHNQPPKQYENGTFSAILLETPEEKPNSYKTVLKINAFAESDTLVQTKEKILAYFEKTFAVQDLTPGTVILFKENPDPVSNNGNPYEFDYKKYLSHQKIYRQVYLDEQKWTKTKTSITTPLILAEKLREKLLTIYQKQNLGENETAIISALTLGYKRELDPETRRVFSAAGAMHILAVSGLHVGIIFGMFVLIFGFMQKSKNGKIMFVVLSVLLLWSYALLTGLSPSVMRAATMFSLVSIASNLNRPANIYNTLVTSAFILLLINPNNLFDVGFQLSYSAVFGIVFLQPKFEKLLQVKNKIIHYFWVLITVSLAAQIATFPFTAYYFHQFPTYFLLTNIVVIPAVFVLIISGVLLLFLSGIPHVSAVIAFITQKLIGGLYIMLQYIESLPQSVLNTPLNGAQSTTLVLALFFCFVFIEFLRVKQLKYSLLLISIVFLISAKQKLEQQKLNELIVYNNRENLTIQLIKGRENYVVTEFAVDSLAYTRQMIENVVAKKKLKKPMFLSLNNSFEDRNLLLSNNFIYFGGKLIEIDLQKIRPPKSFPTDFLILNAYYNPDKLENKAYSRVITSKNQRPKSPLIHSLPTMGSFHSQWQQK